jgi:hypothetical protein
MYDSQFERLLSLQVDGELNAADRVELARYIREDAAARTTYARVMALHAWLDWDCHPAASALRPLPKAPAIPSWSWRFSNSPALASLFIGLVVYGTFGLLVWQMSGRFVDRSLDHIAMPSPDANATVRSNSEKDLTGNHPTDALLKKVAVVRGTDGAQWSPQSRFAGLSTLATTNIQVGELLQLERGSIDMQLAQGGVMRVEGPAEWTIQGANQVELVRGKLQASVPDRAIGFTVTTPTAHVVDLGTEFDVFVDETGATNVAVLKGSVAVSMVTATLGNRADVASLLVAGQSIRVDEKGKGVVQDAPTTSREKRIASADRANSLDLVDIIAGGDGLGQRRNVGINPVTGRTVYPTDEDVAQFDYFGGRGKYVAVEHRPLIDGVNVPSPAHGLVQLDSAGHTFGGFPKTNSQTYGCIWAGGALPLPKSHAKHGAFRTTFDGKLNYAVAPHSCLEMVPNKLITFDLEAIRGTHRHKVLQAFRAVAGVTEPTVKDTKGIAADIWVFVDGQVRYQRTGINATHGPEQINIALEPTARFLTLSSTDGGNTPHFDAVIFGDPSIVFENQIE